MRKSFLFVTILLLLIVPATTFAFSETTSGGDVSSVVNPETPGANQQVSITLQSYALNLDASTITWQQNGKQVASGLGLKSYNFAMGKAGSKISIAADITDLAGNHAEKMFIFTANDVDLLWEANTYTPPFYKGHSEPTSESKIKLYAIPHITDNNGNVLGTDRLIFNWKKNDQTLAVSSGVGKNLITAVSSQLADSDTYLVTIESLAGEILASKAITIPIRTPQILFYEYRPLEGTEYQTGLTNLFNLSQPQLTIKAEPYFFSNDDLSSGELNYNWLINNSQATPNANDHRYLTIQKASNSGYAQLGIKITDAKKIFELGQNVLRVNFFQAANNSSDFNGQ